MLSLGASRPWPDVMKIISGRDKHEASALLEYYQPLADWLKEENKGADIQWSDTCPQIVEASASQMIIDNVLLLFIGTITYVYST